MIEGKQQSVAAHHTEVSTLLCTVCTVQSMNTPKHPLVSLSRKEQVSCDCYICHICLYQIKYRQEDVLKALSVRNTGFSSSVLSGCDDGSFGFLW